MNSKTIEELIFAAAERTPDAPAILAPDRSPLTYNELLAQVTYVGARLAELGIRTNDRVALVLPNGPEMAVAFLAIGSYATCAPLNPAYQKAEYDFYLADLDAKALMTMPGSATPAIQSAQALGVPVIELLVDPHHAAGKFELFGTAEQSSSSPLKPKTEDIALVLHTSGTTSRPKIVPLSHQNVCASADHIKSTLALTAADRCLNIMPLFHIHGLMAATLASMAAGAVLVCTPGFYVTEFFQWMDAFQPTWYTAVPTMHQAILARAGSHQEIIDRTPLRFVRSSSASLAPQVMAELEQVFQAPVVEAYGMTEAAHQMTSNPLPPKARKAGSVGLPAGPKVSIMHEQRPWLLPLGNLGEIVIQGPNVTAGYAGNPEANKKAFADGWFRTGDQGYMDDEGYLFITGRLKEIINRGGEKISPREIDEVLLEHPAVRQATTFAMPDEALGEEVAAAVVLNERAASEQELRQFAAEKLAIFKVPRRILIVDEIPKGPTGKLQRIGLADKLGLGQPTEVAAEYIPPRNALEADIAKIWCAVLQVPQVGVQDRFLDAGGDSMLATVLHTQLKEELGIDIPLVDLFAASTIERQALLLQRSSGVAEDG